MGKTTRVGIFHNSPIIVDISEHCTKSSRNYGNEPLEKSSRCAILSQGRPNQLSDAIIVSFDAKLFCRLPVDTQRRTEAGNLGDMMRFGCDSKRNISTFVIFFGTKATRKTRQDKTDKTRQDKTRQDEKENAE